MCFDMFIHNRFCIFCAVVMLFMRINREKLKFQDIKFLSSDVIKKRKTIYKKRVKIESDEIEKRI